MKVYSLSKETSLSRSVADVTLRSVSPVTKAAMTSLHWPSQESLNDVGASENASTTPLENGSIDENTSEAPIVDPTTNARLRFAIGVAHLTALAGLLHLTAEASAFEVFDTWKIVFGTQLVACSVAAAWLSPGKGLRRIRGALAPCLSLPPWNADKTEAWIPGLGWRKVDNTLRNDVDKRFAVPMVIVAVLVLPLFATEHFFKASIDASPILLGLVATASATVWASFAFEFIICCTLAEKKFAYVKQHWLDAIIILLPLIAFLRAARLARLAKIQKTARVFRLRGVAMRLWQAVVVFELIDRVLFPTEEKRLAHLEKKRAGLLEDLAAVDSRIAKLTNPILMSEQSLSTQSDETEVV